MRVSDPFTLAPLCYNAYVRKTNRSLRIPSRHLKRRSLSRLREKWVKLVSALAVTIALITSHSPCNYCQIPPPASSKGGAKSFRAIYIIETVAWSSPRYKSICCKATSSDKAVHTHKENRATDEAVTWTEICEIKEIKTEMFRQLEIISKLCSWWAQLNGDKLPKVRKSC